MRKFLTGNQLKILALIAMTCDHIGKQVLLQYPILQIIGRLALPIFAYMIAEGCTYTKNRKRYLGTMAAVALLCQVVYGVAMGSLYQCILVTFTLSIVLIYALDNAIRHKTAKAWMTAGGTFIGIYFISVCLPDMLSHTDFAIDYGWWGILLPVLIYIAHTKTAKLLALTIGLILLAASLGGIQWYSLLVLPLMLLYNGKRGEWKLKNLFYIYYPVHLVVIYLIGLFL